MRDFDFAKAPEKLLTPEMVQMIGRLHEYKGRQDILLNLYKDDGKIPEGIQKMDKGYREVYKLICNNYELITPSPREIMQMHRVLVTSANDGDNDANDAEKGMGTTSKTKYSRTINVDNTDEYYDEDYFRNVDGSVPQIVRSRNPQLQRSGLRFRETFIRSRASGMERAESAYDFNPAEAVSLLCDEFNIAWEEERIDKLILIPMFITDLRCIRPFDTGNEKICRLLALLLMLRAGYVAGKYISIDELIDESILTYSNVLQASSEGWEEQRNNYSIFAAYYLSVMCKAYSRFEGMLKMPGQKKLSKPDKIKQIIDTKGGSVTKKEIMELCPDISKVTVERALTDLVKKGYIVKTGGGPSTAYVKA